MAVTITRSRPQNEELGKNPWDSVDMAQFLFYCCPDCQFQCQRDFLLRSHLSDNHPESWKKCKRTILADKLIEKFLKENHHKLQVEDLNLPACIEVIKNPPVAMAAPILTEPFHKDLPNALEDLAEAAKGQINPPDLEDIEPESLFHPDDNYETNVNLSDAKVDQEIMMNIEKDSKKCQDCSIVFLTPFRLLRHIKKFHGGVTPTMASSDTPIGDDSNVAEMPRPYACQLCQKSFTSHAYLASHIRKAHEKRFKCEECGKCYGGSSYLREHIEAVHRKTKNFTCESCAASFYSKTQLINHCLRNHSEGEERPCEECGKTFTNDLSLKLHVRNVHQPVKSMCAQCGKEYPNEVSLRKHVQCVHEKKRPFQCHICSKMFGSKWYVQQHVLKMHEDVHRVPTFKCSDCQFEFATMRERNAHVLKDHGKKFSGKLKKPKFELLPNSTDDQLMQIVQHHGLI